MKHKVRRRMTQSGKRRFLTIIIVLFVVSFIGVAAYYFIEKKQALEGIYLSEIDTLTARINSGTKMVYRSTEPIKAGEELNSEKLERIEILSDDCGYCDSSDIGRTVLVDIPEGTYITELLLTDSVYAERIREVEYSCINITSNISAGDYVDIRLFYPDGTDYIIMSKKQVAGLNDTKLVADLFVEEEELLLMDSAVVDCALYEGSHIYATRYVQPSVQEPSVVNYTPSEATISLIRNNPNIIGICNEYLSEELRRSRESELQLFLSDEPQARYDTDGMYIGTPTRAELKAEDLFSEDNIPGTELPTEYGNGLWED